ncbi:nucleoside hydrolase [Brevundimonas aurifodinae]|uniref:Nucleoside hydrolase n=2 Tax=Brevundimonas TaxID=41275 RepID=A0ABV1NM97_9CAUL|nr:MAG: nucleoside hydrolase [Brevundimonas sp. 12-68-7]OYX34735.1 MAG: nucleoside hydrolase [Brevundimonas subvibrioides]
MTRRGLIIDCDPGVDDAVGLLLAFGSPELDLLAITTVAGNVSLERTTRNARILRQIAGREDVPVFAGVDRPLRRPRAEAAEFHGAEGLGGLETFEPDAPAEPGGAVEAIVERVIARPPGAVAVAVMGPMTNLALALRAEPRLAERLGPVVVMGGARSEGGNITPSAEFNIWADPEAAAEVFAAGCRVTALGLDATHQVRGTGARIAAIEAQPGNCAQTTASLLRFSQDVERRIVGWEWAPLHDPCTVAWLLRPDLFRAVPCRIAVETESDLTRGHTAVEFRVEASAACHHWVVEANAAGVFDLIAQRLGTLP